MKKYLCLISCIIIILCYTALVVGQDRGSRSPRVPDSTTIDGVDSGSFLRSDQSDVHTSGVLTLPQVEISTYWRSKYPYIDVTHSDFGAVGNGVADDRAAIAAADTAAVLAGVPLLFANGDYKISSDITIASDLILYQGALITPDAGDTVTINGHIDAGTWCIFAGDGSIAGTPKNDFVRPEWWGAVADGSTDCADAFEKAILFAHANKVGAVQLSAGVYYIDSAKTFTNVREVTIRGTTTKPQYTSSRTAGSAIVFNGIATDTPGWKFTTCRGLAFKDFWMYTNGTKAHSGIYLDQTATSVFDGVNIQDFTTASVYIDTSFSLTFQNCTFSSSDAGVRSAGTCQNITFLGCSLIQNTTCGAWVYGQNYTFIGCDFEGQPRGIDQESSVGRVVSRGWLVEGNYFEAMTDNAVMYLVFHDYSQFGPAYLSDSAYYIYLNSSDHNVVVNWRGDVNIQSASTDNTIVHVAGTVTDDGVDTIQLADIDEYYLRKDGAVALTDHWKAGTKGLQIAGLGVSKTGANYGDEVVSNGTFDSDTTGWTAVVCTLSSEAGGQSGNCLQILNAAGGGGYEAQARQEIAVIPFLRYKLSFYFKKGTGSYGRVWVDSTEFSRSPTSGDLYSTGALSDVTWTEYTGEFVPTGSSIFLMLESHSPSKTALFDEVTIKPIIAGDLAVGKDLYVGGDLTVTGDFITPYANAVTVSSSGADYTTIQAALDANDAGTLVLVYPGTYTDDTINRYSDMQLWGLYGLSDRKYQDDHDWADYGKDYYYRLRFVEDAFCASGSSLCDGYCRGATFMYRRDRRYKDALWYIGL